MLHRRLSRYRDRVHRELATAFESEQTSREVAASFAIGIFITTLPSGGLGIGLFFVLAYLWSWANRTAMLASVVVLNPAMKPAVYVVSHRIGSTLLGADPPIAFDHSMLDYTLTAVQRVVVGVVPVALALAAAGYVLVLRMAGTYRRRLAASDVPPGRSESPVDDGRLDG